MTRIKIWLDDLRQPPDDAWTWAQSSGAAILLIEAICEQGLQVEISLDYDLGGDDTAILVAKLLEELAHDGAIQRAIWHIHSANPVGRKNLIAAMQSADRYWDRLD